VNKRRQRVQAKVARFAQQYARKKPGGMGEPNDRQYDRKVEQMVRHMDPVELDRLLHDDAGTDHAAGG
jgi:hypothetical protein